LAPPAGAARFLLLRRPRADLVQEATRWPCSRVAREGGQGQVGETVGLPLPGCEPLLSS
jgi:hypothetical protein